MERSYIPMWSTWQLMNIWIHWSDRVSQALCFSPSFQVGASIPSGRIRLLFHFQQDSCDLEGMIHQPCRVWLDNFLSDFCCLGCVRLTNDKIRQLLVILFKQSTHTCERKFSWSLTYDLQITFKFYITECVKWQTFVLLPSTWAELFENHTCLSVPFNYLYILM